MDSTKVAWILIGYNDAMLSQKSVTFQVWRSPETGRACQPKSNDEKKVCTGGQVKDIEAVLHGGDHLCKRLHLHKTRASLQQRLCQLNKTQG